MISKIGAVILRSLQDNAPDKKKKTPFLLPLVKSRAFELCKEQK